MRWRRHSGILVSAVVAVALLGRSNAQPPSDRSIDQSFAFKSVKDKGPLGLRDTAALVSLLRRARQIQPADHAKVARSELSLQEIAAHCEKYRGVPLVAHGIARRVYSSQSPLAAGNRLLEVWITTADKGPNPLACIIEEPPPGFPDRPVISEPVVVRGYFLKLMAYKVGQKEFAAPLLIGTLEHRPKDDQSVIDPPSDEVFVRLPDGAEARSVGPAAEEKLSLTLDRSGRLTIDGDVIAKKSLTRKLEALAASIRFNVRAGGVVLPRDRELPAALTFRAPDDIPCTTIHKLMLDCQATGFIKYFLEPASDDPSVPQPAGSADPAPARKENNLPDEQRTIQIRLRADQKGRIARIQLGGQTLQGYDALKRELTEILSDPNAPFDRANVELDPSLKYSEMVRLSKVLASPLMKSIHFKLAEASFRQ
jgi:hypothetical protein